MELLERFGEEHALIDELAGALFRWVETTGGSEDAASFAHALGVCCSGFHHQREDDILVPALVGEAEVPQDRGPLMVIQQEHREVESLTRELARTAERDVARRLARLLWEHVDKEDSVLFPDAGQRLRRAGVLELEDRPMTPEEQAALELARELIERYPPLDDPDHVRGAGCIACSAFADTCRGIEAEWWNQWEWEDHLGHSHEG